MARPYPDILAYLDFRAWLTDAVAEARAADPALTYRELAAACGYKSSGAMTLVMTGRRGLSQAGASRVASFFGLSTDERAHFKRMHAYATTNDFKARADLLESMQVAQRFAKEWRAELDTVAFYRSWFVPVVRELVSLDDFQEDPDWIRRRIRPSITRRQAEQALRVLCGTGQLVRNASGGLVQAQPVQLTDAEVRSDALRYHQQEMMRLAAQALVDQPAEERDMRVVTMAISHNQASEIKALLTQTQREVMAIVTRDEPIEAVYQLNTQLFALTERAARPNTAPDESES
ncbi:MAG: hypothetical protein ACJAYU_005046 [Bradymonadia bacterium]